MLSATDLANFYNAYEDIMSSNHAPLDEQLAGIHEVLAKAEEVLQQLQADENNHNSHPELQATKKSSSTGEVSNFIEKLHCVTSPMRRVPPEIIGEILLQTLSNDNSEALSHALLWSEFEIKRIIPLFPLDVWLSRSKNTCLKIRGHLTSWNDDGILFQRVVAESHRWRSLQWSACNFSVVQGVEWWSKPMPRLRKLDVSGVIFDSRRLMSSSPNLTSLSIEILLLHFAHSHEDPNPANTFVHTNLQRIATDNLSFGVRYCKFPQLRKLVTICSNLRVVGDMLCRSQCTLEESDVGGYDNTGNVWRILKGQPVLRSLRLNINGDHRNCMLRGLLVRRNKPALVPSLEHLSFILKRKDQLPLLLEVLRSRRDESMMQPPTLKSARILYQRYTDIERFEQEFIALKDKEFDIQLSHSFGRRSCM